MARDSRPNGEKEAPVPQAPAQRLAGSQAFPCSPSLDEWESQTAKERQDYLLQIDTTYHSIVDNLLDESNRTVKIVAVSMKRYHRWRIGLILATGGMAIINLFAALPGKPSIFGFSLNLSVAAAVYAVLLAVVSNLENFLRYAGRAQTYRESRELFLDAFREFEMLWHLHVRPFGDQPMACANAAELYSRLVARDIELRSKVKDLSEAKKSTSAVTQIG